MMEGGLLKGAARHDKGSTKCVMKLAQCIMKGHLTKEAQRYDERNAKVGQWECKGMRKGVQRYDTRADSHTLMRNRPSP